MAPSENFFLEIGAEDFVTEKDMEKAEYFVYCDFFIAHLWGESLAHNPKGKFFEVPKK